MSEFRKNCPSAFYIVWRKGWIDDIRDILKYEVMASKQHPKDFWTKERCVQEALKYETRSAFKAGSPGAHTAAYTHGWIDELCHHMKIMKPHYTKQECAKEALKYKTKTDFIKNGRPYYRHALDNGFINEICQHMKKLGSPEKRAIYVFEFNDNYAYIGLTLNLERREKEHRTDKNSPVYKHIQESGHQPDFKVLTNYLPKKKAAQKEDDTIFEYSKKGWFMLNKKRGGDLGSKGRKYTKKTCRQIALQYSDRTEFHKNNRQFYNYISKRGWLEELCAHMTRQKNGNGYWTKEKCAEEARKHKKRIQFQKSNPAAHSAAFKNGWLDEICAHMSYNEQEPRIWTKERCKEEVRKYITRGKFKENVPSAYKIAMNHGWLDELFEYMPYHGYRNERVMIANENRDSIKNRKFWTEERIMDEAKKYGSITAFKRNCSGAYDAARKMNLLDKLKALIESGKTM